MKESISLGTLVAFTGYINMLIWPMRMLGWLTNLIAQANASAKKITDIMDVEPAIKDTEDSLRLRNVKGDIEFNNVSFKYREEYVLRNVSLKVKPGSTVAIMGTTGSGKSSIINLIGRYYDVTDGAILVDGYDVKEVNLKDLRSRMAIVPQDTFLFSASIEENIRFGKEDASFEEIREACRLACAEDFIEELEEKYDTVIGERGIGLSGGQKQRLAIARALIRESSILILDDATSALDMETEYRLLKNLHEKHKKATTFIIAHRISAVKNADQILYVEDGKVVERGTHEQLLQRKGKYYEIYCEQFKDFDSLEESEEVV
jgi:ATP-binding cassette subfamily B protein